MHIVYHFTWFFKKFSDNEKPNTEIQCATFSMSPCIETQNVKNRNRQK